jgi:hypothetical protein
MRDKTLTYSFYNGAYDYIWYSSRSTVCDLVINSVCSFVKNSVYFAVSDTVQDSIKNSVCNHIQNKP